MSITRRNLLLAAGATAVGVAGLVPARAKPVLTADGLYREPWFLESFLDLRDDLQQTSKEGKRFAIMWELKGCPYCKETHFVNFAQARIADYIKANFNITQLNIIGSLPVTDFDGEQLPEKKLAAKYGVRFTPTFQFFPSDLAAIKALPPLKREVARAPGYLRPNDFLAMFRFVREKAYEQGSFRDFLKSQPS
jgi:thioredoxin-related protein